MKKSTILKLGNNVEVTTNGSSADGINLTENAYGSKVIVGDDARIEANGAYGGMGVRANNSINGTASQSNSIQVGDRLTVITKGSGGNFLDGVGYGIYAGLRTWKSSVGDSHVFIGKQSNITTYGDDAHAIYANRSGKIVLGSGTSVTVNGDGASAIRAEGSDGSVGNTTITLLGDTSILTDSTKSNQYAMYATGGGSSKGVITNVMSEGSLTELGGTDLLGNTLSISNTRVFNMEGNFYAGTNGIIHLDMTDGSKIVGATQLAGSGGTRGNITWLLSGENSSWLMTNDSTLTDLTLDNGATVYLNRSGQIGQTLTVEGDYTGNNGNIVFNGKLDGDTSPIDQLVIEGNVSGNTNVVVNNIGGLGEKTITGIRLITVGGNSPSDSFVQSGRIVSGAYDYFLKQSNEQGQDANNWYLTNKLTPPTPDPDPDPGPSPSIIRPEASAYLGNAYAANNMFQMSLHDRVGELNFTEQAQKEQSVWARYDKRKTKFTEGTGQLKASQDYDVVQFGIDFLKKERKIENGNRFIVAGIMGGYGDAATNSHGILHSAKGTLNGWSIGTYATWYDEYNNKTGRYLDIWAMFNTYSAKVYGEQVNVESYKMSGLTASIEGGYDKLLTNPIGRSENRFLKLQAQVSYQGVNGNDHFETNGTQIQFNNTNIQTRIGARYYSKPADALQHPGQPYVELNWYHNTKVTKIKMDETNVSMSGARNIGELKLGYELRMKKDWQLWGYAFGAVGGSNYYSYGVRLGLKAMF